LEFQPSKALECVYLPFASLLEPIKAIDSEELCDAHFRHPIACLIPVFDEVEVQDSQLMG
ncbi:hypothetical protein, partial [Pseudomonas aeruginosa]